MSDIGLYQETFQRVRGSNVFNLSRPINLERRRMRSYQSIDFDSSINEFEIKNIFPQIIGQETLEVDLLRIFNCQLKTNLIFKIN